MTIKKRVEADIEHFISKGADVITDKKIKDEYVNISLRIPAELLEELDVLLESNKWMTRTAWICDAVHRKLSQRTVP